jgi:hypothetical protein
LLCFGCLVAWLSFAVNTYAPNAVVLDNDKVVRIEEEERAVEMRQQMEREADGGIVVVPLASYAEENEENQERQEKHEKQEKEGGLSWAAEKKKAERKAAEVRKCYYCLLSLSLPLSPLSILPLLSVLWSVTLCSLLPAGESRDQRNRGGGRGETERID